MGVLPNDIPQSEAREAATEIVRTLRAQGHIAYFAGGCVRDELLGLVPTDYDVATDAVPERIASLFPRTAEVGASFGVMLVKIGRTIVEVATFRADGAYTDNRRPDSIRFSDPVEDAHRRDFTVNALFLDPLVAPSATEITTSTLVGIIDHVNGVADILARVLRAVGDPEARLAEDHLRALRAARLAAKLRFMIEQGTADAIRKHASDLRGVSRERIGEEVRRMLSHPTRATAAQLLRELALEAPVLDRAASDQPRANSIDERQAFPRLANLHERDGLAMYPMCLAAWMLDIGEVPAAFDASDKYDASDKAGALPNLLTRLRKALTLSNDDRDGVRDVLTIHAALMTSGGASGKASSESSSESEWALMGVAKQKRCAARRYFVEALEVLRASPIAAHADAAVKVDAEVAALARTHGGIAPKPLLDGDALIEAGLAPGPRFKYVLDRVYDAQLEGAIKDAEAAFELARMLY